jgi:ATP-dependent protease ClpP protease subunit
MTYPTQTTPKWFLEISSASRINSPGGSVQEGYAIYELLRSNPAEIRMFVDGEAASIASLILMAGTYREISANGTVMIHDPHVTVSASAEELRAIADLLDLHRENIIQTYASRTGQASDDLAAMMSANGPMGTTMNSERAKELGFVDHVAARQAMAAMRLIPLAQVATRALEAPIAVVEEVPRTIEQIQETITMKLAQGREL